MLSATHESMASPANRTSRRSLHIAPEAEPTWKPRSGCDPSAGSRPDVVSQAAKRIGHQSRLLFKRFRFLIDELDRDPVRHGESNRCNHCLARINGNIRRTACRRYDLDRCAHCRQRLHSRQHSFPKGTRQRDGNTIELVVQQKSSYRNGIRCATMNHRKQSKRFVDVESVHLYHSQIETWSVISAPF